MTPKVPSRPVGSSSSIEETDEKTVPRHDRAKRSPAEIAQYVAEFSAELSFLARQVELDLLAYLLDMARLEAIRAVQAGQRKIQESL